MKKRMITGIFLLLMASCAQIDLDKPKGEEFPLYGPKRAVLGKVSYPAQAEGLVSRARIQESLEEWAASIRLSRPELDEVRLFKGGEMGFLLENIRNNSQISMKMAELRKLGVIFQIHPQQIMNQALPADPSLAYGENILANYTLYLIEKARTLLVARSPLLAGRLEEQEDAILGGVEEELNLSQSFPYPYQNPRLTHSFNPDKNWSMGYENLSSSNPFQGLHRNPPSLLLKALGLFYGMRTVTVEQNFFDEKISLVETSSPGILYYLEKKDFSKAYGLLGRLLALCALSSLPEQLDSRYPEVESLYRDKWLMVWTHGIQEVLSKPEELDFRADFFEENWVDSAFGDQVVNYLDNDMAYAGNIHSVFLRLAQRADFYPSPAKTGNGLYDWAGEFTPYYPLD
ncbi:MAG: hypothetical protein CVV50_03920, partial [Spirochaetae bacterium HGW-Spirochaetae-6]